METTATERLDEHEEIAQSQLNKTEDSYWVVTPEDAAAVLSWNDYNRPPKIAKIRQYAADMRAGEWLYNGVPIIIASVTDRTASDGSPMLILLDGQNRLTAVIESGVTVNFRVNLLSMTFDEALRVMGTYDQGASRTLADIISVARKSGKRYADFNSQDLAAAATALGICDIMINQGESVWRSFSRPALEAYAIEHEDDLQWAAEVRKFGRKQMRGRAKITAGVLAAGIAIHRLPDNAQPSVSFFTQLSTGDNLVTGNPIKLLREEIMEGQRSHIIVGYRGAREHERWYNATMRSWNSWATGRAITQLRIYDDKIITPLSYEDKSKEWES